MHPKSLILYNILIVTFLKYYGLYEFQLKFFLSNFPKKHSFVLMRNSKEFKKLLCIEFLDSFSSFIVDFTLVLYLTNDFRVVDELSGLAYATYGSLVVFYGVLIGFIIDVRIKFTRNYNFNKHQLWVVIPSFSFGAFKLRS